MPVVWPVTHDFTFYAISNAGTKLLGGVFGGAILSGRGYAPGSGQSLFASGRCKSSPDNRLKWLRGTYWGEVERA